MAYHSSKRVRTEQERHIGALEVFLIVLVILAVAGLVAFVVKTAGGGALMT